MTKKIDPVHFFNALGRSVLGDRYLEDQVKRLEAENAELKRRLRAQIERAKITGTEDQVPITRH